jgi:hypothetical protein
MYDAVLTECGYSEPDWRCGCTGTGHWARIQHHPDDAEALLCVSCCVCIGLE